MTEQADPLVRPHMTWQRGDLKIDGVSVGRLVGDYGTPLYVTSVAAFEDRIRLARTAMQESFAEHRVYYALKANWGRPLVEAVKRASEGFDIVSAGEWDHLRACGVDPAVVCFAGVGKTREEIAAALSASVGILNIEHLGELQFALAQLERQPSASRLALRLNPCIEVDTHPHLRTGALDSKFGMRAEEMLSTLALPSWRDCLERRDASGRPLSDAVRGVHVHVGSQLLKGPLFESVVRAVMELAESLIGLGFPIDHLDFGGGLGVPHTGVPLEGADLTSHIAALRHAVFAAVKSRPVLQARWGDGLERCQIGIEPGRSLVASSTVFLTEVLYTRVSSPQHRFAYVNGGMNDFPRPSLYGARHDVCVAHRPQGTPNPLLGQTSLGISGAVEGGAGLQIVGPVCESADVLRRDPGTDELAVVAPGDVLAFFEAGAYCRSMASEYNLRPLPRTAYLHNGSVAVE